MLSLLLSLYISAPPPQHFPVPPTIQPAQVIQLSSSRPYTQASSALVADLNTNSILYQNNSNKRLPIASITKLMTVLILLEENQLDEIVTIPAEATQLGGTTMYLHSNEQITVLDLIKGSLIQSGNDAAYSLAIHNAGTANEFVKKMNAKSKQLSLYNTNFANPMGFDDPKNYSTAQDLLILAKAVSTLR